MTAETERSRRLRRLVAAEYLGNPPTGHNITELFQEY
ncbi:hypothetical protein LCGC14_2276980, partial [marine sediment metagenome]